MRRYELGMTLNYAKNWGVPEGIREFIQNAIDEEKENPENKMNIDYKDGILTISNKKSSLGLSSLLLGSTTKDGKSNLIGEHGEGYKVATVVLMRNGITVKIYNNEDKSIWTSKIVKSKRYGSDIVVFDVEKKMFCKDNDLVIELQGVSEDDWNKIISNTLFLRNDIIETETKQSPTGRILLNKKFKGHIYVEGLFVCIIKELDKGYDFNAGILKLDRDRGLVDNFDLKSAIATLVIGTGDANYIKETMESPDSLFISNRCCSDILDEVSDSVYNDFIDTYGENAIPVNDYNLYNKFAKSNNNVVLVTDDKYNYLYRKPRNYGNVAKDPDDLNLQFDIWLNRVQFRLNANDIKEIKELWQKIQNK